MKRFLLLIVTSLLLSVQGYSQFGVKAGLNFNKLGDIDFAGYDNFTSNKTGFNAGILYKFKIPVIGLAIQPELMYTQTNSSVDNLIVGGNHSLGTGDLKLGYLQLPVGLQFGLDLVLFRPYIQVVPYIGYAVSTKNTVQNLEWDVDKFKYGIGLGAGIDIWKFQISGRYSWDLGNVAEFKWDKEMFNGGKTKGFELSLALLF